MNDENSSARRFPAEDGSPTGNGNHPSVEQLSEYLDGADNPEIVEREAITQHLASCQACQDVLTDLQRMLQTLGSLPTRDVPRSFAITRDMLQPAKTPAAVEPVVLQESAQWHARHAAKVRWATAVAAMLFVLVISADLVLNGLGNIETGSDDSGDEITTMHFEEESEDSIGARVADDDEAEAIPTAAAAQDAPVEEEAAEEEQEESEPPSDMPESAEVPESDDAAGAEESADSMDAPQEESAGEDEDLSVMSMEPEDISGETAAEIEESSGDSNQLRWRIAEVSLALVLALLLAVMIGLPKQRGSRRS